MLFVGNDWYGCISSDAKIHELEQAATKAMLLCGVVGAGLAPCFPGAQREKQRSSVLLRLR